MPEDIHEVVDKISRNTEELSRLYVSLGYRGYQDRKSHGDSTYSEEAETAKEILDGILWNITYHRMRGEVDTAYFKEAAYGHARKYIDCPRVRAPWMTTFVLTAVLDAELAPLTREADDRSVPIRLTSYLPKPWGTIVPAFLFFAFLSFVGYLSWAAFRRESILWGSVAAAYLLWTFFSRVQGDRQRVTSRGELKTLAQVLRLVRNEVSSGNYDGTEIATRLRKCEAAGLYVHSLTYPLLDLSQLVHRENAG